MVTEDCNSAGVIFESLRGSHHVAVWYCTNQGSVTGVCGDLTMSGVMDLSFGIWESESELGESHFANNCRPNLQESCLREF